MSRPLRIEFDGAFYHITSRGNARKQIFADDDDRKIFLDILDKVNDKYNFLCHAYCLMDNHYHLLVETPDGNLSNGMRQLNGVYIQRYNRRNKKDGHVFQGRYKAILIQKETHFLEVCRYIVLNPVRARAEGHLKSGNGQVIRLHLDLRSHTNALQQIIYWNNLEKQERLLKRNTVVL